MSIPSAQHVNDSGTGSDDQRPQPSTVAIRFRVCRGSLAFAPTLAILLSVNPVAGNWAALYIGCVALPLAFIVALGAGIGGIKSAAVTGAVVLAGGLTCLCDLRGSGYVTYWLLIAAAAVVGATLGAVGGIIGRLMYLGALGVACSTKFVLEKLKNASNIRTPNSFDGGAYLLRQKSSLAKRLRAHESLAV